MATGYRIVYEHGPHSWGAYVPRLPGCVAVGQTREEVGRLIHEAIPFHLEGIARRRAERRASPRASRRRANPTKPKTPTRAGAK